MDDTIVINSKYLENTESIFLKNVTIDHIDKKIYNKIKYLELDNCLFKNNIFDIDFKNFPNLETLILSNMSFYDLENILNLEKLKKIVLNKNDIDVVNFDYIPESVEHINLDDNPIIFLENEEQIDGKLKFLSLKNVNLKERPDIEADIFEYSYDSDSLKVCDLCLKQIFNMEPYYNKDNDGFFICTECMDSSIDEDEKDVYEKKINIFRSRIYCDELDCEMKRSPNVELFFKRDDYIWYNFFDNHMVCNHCYYENEYEDYNDYIDLNVDYVNTLCYKFDDNHDFLMFEDDNNDNKFYTFDDIKPYNAHKFYKCILKKYENNNDDYEYEDICAILYLKYHFNNKINFDLLDNNRIGSIFTSGNSYIVDYFLKNIKMSMRQCKKYFWRLCTNKDKHVDTLLIMINDYPSFFPKEYLFKPSPELRKNILTMIDNDNIKILFAIKYHFDLSFKDLIEIEQEHFNKLCIKGYSTMVQILPKKNVSFQNALDNVLGHSDLNDKDIYEIVEYLYDKHDGTLNFNHELNCKKKLFLENILKFSNRCDVIKEVFMQQKKHETTISITVPYKNFVKKCKENNVEFASLMAEIFQNFLFVEIEDNEIVDYGKKEKGGLFKKGDFKYIVKEECCICMDKQSTIITDCKHQFCKLCIKKTLDNSNNCPLCRQDIKDKLFYID